MRIRSPFAGAFTALILLLGYLGLSKLQISAVNDKVLHFVAFFALTISFYWILDTTRRRALNGTFLFVTLFLGIASEFLQAALPNDRNFDPIDIGANIAGSALALLLNTLYHRRMLDRKRKRKLEGYGLVAGDGQDDLELGEGGSAEREIGADGAAREGEEEEEDDAGAWDEIGGESLDEDESGKGVGSGK
ncbi:hypothetical protein MMC25_005063 [Agyrium rufum]|nr:hypothetical protein [Agyrium rufum]